MSIMYCIQKRMHPGSVSREFRCHLFHKYGVVCDETL
ncbi:hypothetical protein T10_3178 [Trichinella papuae]|uniref:Uncharacterized protein n=1 Tax=Trichinella papuae TaxID=268474 RepID=A0A0V1LX13_9BILA|nr:hypothetical protein T10_3178 [Trichinella papuae]